MDIKTRLEKLEGIFQKSDTVEVLYSDGSIKKMIWQDAIVAILGGVTRGLYGDDPEPVDGERISETVHVAITDDTPWAVDILACKSNLIDALLGRSESGGGTG